MRRQEGNIPLGVRGPFVIRLRAGFLTLSATPGRRELADHLKKARLDRGIPQRDAARAIGCSPLTYLHWEKVRVAPHVRFWPAILAFLGYETPGRSLRALVGGSARHVKPRGYPDGS